MLTILKFLIIQFKGDVYKYRMSRWCTLFGEYPCPSEFKNPGSNVCMEKVQSICSNGSTSGYSTRSSSTSNWSNGSFEGTFDYHYSYISYI